MPCLASLIIPGKHLVAAMCGNIANICKIAKLVSFFKHLYGKIFFRIGENRANFLGLRTDKLDV